MADIGFSKGKFGYVLVGFAMAYKNYLFHLFKNIPDWFRSVVGVVLNLGVVVNV